MKSRTYITERKNMSHPRTAIQIHRHTHIPQAVSAVGTLHIPHP